MRLYVLDTGVAAVPLASDFPVPAPALSADREEPATGRFRLGAIVATPGAIERMERHGIDARQLLARHSAGDWGDIDPEDVGVNEEALRCGGPLMSAYGSDTNGYDHTIWITTEADRAPRRSFGPRTTEMGTTRVRLTLELEINSDGAADPAPTSSSASATTRGKIWRRRSKIRSNK